MPQAQGVNPLNKHKKSPAWGDFVLAFQLIEWICDRWEGRLVFGQQQYRLQNQKNHGNYPYNRYDRVKAVDGTPERTHYFNIIFKIHTTPLKELRGRFPESDSPAY